MLDCLSTIIYYGGNMKKILCAAASSLLLLYGCANETGNSNVSSGAPDLKDDFYTAVNYNTLSSWVIPADKSSISYFDNIEDKNYDRLNSLIQQTVSSNPAKGTDEYNVKALYETATDWEKRNISGYGQFQVYFDKIDGAATISDLLKVSMELNRKYAYSPFFYILISADLADSTKNVYYLTTEYGLSKEYWLSENTLFSTSYIEYLKNLWILNGTQPQEAEQIVKDVTDMMKEIAKVSLSASELINPSLINNRYTLSDIPAKLNNNVLLDDLLQYYEGSIDDTIIIMDEKALNKLAEYFTDKNLRLLQNYAKTLLYVKCSDMIDLESYKAYLAYQAQIAGLTEIMSVEKSTNKQIHKILQFELGRMYVNKYLSDEIKTDIKNMVTDIQNIYRQRIDKLSWMSAATKEQAKLKLDKMNVVVGYDEANGIWPQTLFDFSYIGKDEGGIYIDNLLLSTAASQDYAYRNKNNPVNKNIITSVPQTVNAAYSLSSNTIKIFPGILQEPIYSANGDAAANAGGIGFVIAHEMTHAFDNNGSQFDADGNAGASWWTESDIEKYNELTQKVIDYYNTYEINGYQINGTLTLSENIADLGAVSCITEYALDKGYDLAAVYTSYATMFATKKTEESEINAILTNVHAPAKVRVNAVLSATDNFYEVFGVQQTNGMYKAPEDRPAIW